MAKKATEESVVVEQAQATETAAPTEQPANVDAWGRPIDMPELKPIPRAAANRAYPDTWRIRLVAEGNPKRGKSAERFALYRDGMTVGEYLDASSKATGSKRGKWAADLRWDAERGYIEFEVGGLTISQG